MPGTNTIDIEITRCLMLPEKISSLNVRTHATNASSGSKTTINGKMGEIRAVREQGQNTLRLFIRTIHTTVGVGEEGMRHEKFGLREEPRCVLIGGKLRKGYRTICMIQNQDYIRRDAKEATIQASGHDSNCASRNS